MFDQPVGRKALAKIDIAVSGDNTIIAAPVSTVHYEIDHIYFICSSPVNIIFEDGTTALTGSMSFGQNGTYAFDNASSLYPVRLTAGNAFTINLGSAIQVSGWVLYRAVGEA